MIRTQISLTEDQMDRLRREAQATGKSIAQLTREAIDHAFPATGWDERVERIKGLAGRYDSGRDDLVVDHDDEVVRAIEEQIGRRPQTGETGETGQTGR